MRIEKHTKTLATTICMTILLCLSPACARKTNDRDTLVLTNITQTKLDQHFRKMLKITETESFPPYSWINDLKALLEKEKISDKELAQATLAFISANRDMGEMLLIVVHVVEQSARTDDLVEIWFEALSSKDKNVAQCAGSMLSLLEDQHYHKESFGLYSDLLRKNNVPANLVEYMYSRNLHRGFRTLLDLTTDVSTPEKKEASFRRMIELKLAHRMVTHAEWFPGSPEWRDILKEDHDAAIAAAGKHLAKLAQAPEWWARLYAVKVAGNKTEFLTGSAAWIKPLTEDKNELVRKAAQEVAARIGPRKLDKLIYD